MGDRHRPQTLTARLADRPVLAVTFDVDWAPDRIVDKIVSVLDDRGLPCTLFCTDYTRDTSGQSSNLSGRYHARHEIGLHPNFQHEGDYDKVWQEGIGLYPQAKGWRSHNGVAGWPIMRSGIALGLRYEVLSPVFRSYVEPSQTNRALKAYYAFTTAFWDSHMLHDPSFEWRGSDLPHHQLFERDDALVILGFHPNILYYDMRTVQEYDARKPSYHRVDEAACFDRRQPQGAMKLFAELLASAPGSCFTTPSAFGSRAGYW